MASIVEATGDGDGPARCAVTQNTWNFCRLHRASEAIGSNHLAKKDPVWQFKMRAVEWASER
jgi:hypothetical protein